MLLQLLYTDPVPKTENEPVIRYYVARWTKKRPEAHK